jgi:hypothetical protein
MITFIGDDLLEDLDPFPKHFHLIVNVVIG